MTATWFVTTMLLVMCCTVLYLAIGVFLCELFDSSSIIAMLFWPVLLILALALYFMLYLPVTLAEWVKDKFDM